MFLSKEDWLNKNFSKDDPYLKLGERAYDILNANAYAADAGYLWSPYRALTPGNNKFKGI